MSQQIITAFVSFERIDQFLNDEPELDEKSDTGALDNTQQGRGPCFHHATLSWSRSEPGKDGEFCLRDLDVECVYGGLTVVAGVVGSGKSSFLLGLLGEMYLHKGDIYMPSGAALATQTP